MAVSAKILVAVEAVQRNELASVFRAVCNAQRESVRAPALECGHDCFVVHGALIAHLVPLRAEVCK